MRRQMNAIIIFLFFLFTFGSLENKLYSSISPQNQYDEVVGLGYSCQIAYQIGENGYRKYAYPFDWITSNFNGLILFIANRGAGFLEWGNFTTSGLIKGTSTYSTTDNVYGFILIHDFYWPLEKSYPIIKAKYDRRIQRFFNLLNSDKRVLFIRLDLSRSEAEYLDQLLASQFPNLSYTILVLNNDIRAQRDWGLKNVRNFYLPQNGTWQGDSRRWKEILSKFLTIHDKSSEPLD
jgi:Putative papain-like cysteine peptidase (DUF1796)